METIAPWETVRSFNRTVVERVGALSDRYLSRDRPLGEARVLWEIGEQGRDVRAIRERLDLDSGYLSRLLRSLEGAGLITVLASDGDQRARTARLTDAGSAERALLDERSNALAQSMLQPLSATQQERLVAAMSTVTTLLTAAAVEIGVLDPDHEHSQYCLREYLAEIDSRFDTGYDPAGALPTTSEAMRPPRGLFLVATLRGVPVGCGALKFRDDGVAEMKRVWISPTVRGLGLGRRLLRELEQRATENGSRVIRLDTNRSLTEAIALYRSAGYEEIAAYNDEPYADHWFEKRLAPTGADATLTAQRYS